MLEVTDAPVFIAGDRLSDGNCCFVLWRRLGEGGMGDVWLALSERLQEQGDLEPFVALKFIHAGRVGSAQARQRLIAEGVQARKISHRNIINTLNVYDDKYYVWLEMDYLGRDPSVDPREPPQPEPPEPARVAYTLSEYRYKQAGSNGLPVSEVLKLLRSVSDALDYACDQHNLIHRDIKSSNVMRCDDGRVVVMDFGLAHQLQRSDSHLSADTIDGAGTPEYRAPETFKAHIASRGQDVYSLAVLAYELLTGKLPWDAERSLIRGKSRAMAEPPPQLELEHSLYEALCKGMAYDPVDRPSNAGALLEALEQAYAQNSDLGSALAKSNEHNVQDKATKTSEKKKMSGDAIPTTKPALNRKYFMKVGLAVVASVTGLVAGWWLLQRSGLGSALEEPAMVEIQAGCFNLGSPVDERLRAPDEQIHKVCFDTFKMGKYELTFDQYTAFALAKDKKIPDDNDWGRAKRPVINVSWFDASKYVQWLSQETGKNYRLPTEDEWEYAARAGTNSPFHTGYTISAKQANFNNSIAYNGSETSRSSSDKSLEVGGLACNSWGLCDVHGNVLEWTCSLFDRSTGATAETCADDNNNMDRVLKGGSWVNEPGWLRSAKRFGGLPVSESHGVGFRVLQEVQ